MDSWVLCPCQRSRLDLLKRMLTSLDHPSDHVVVVATYPDPICPWELDLSDHVIGFPTAEINIAKWWNIGLEYIAGLARPRHEILALSSDYVGRDYSVAMIGAFLRQHDLSMAGPNHWTNEPQIFKMHNQRHAMGRVPGGCWMLAGESGLRVDEAFRWWYSDDDFEMQARQRSGTGIIPGTGLEGGPDTALSEEKACWAVEDRKKYIQKWGCEPW